ncbi:hypothetical protein MMC22_000688 [Lobaria immixta]|nr:hypothetical protein [Lobaria immixta]
MAVGNGMETYAARLASFSIAHPAKKRGSDTKGTKTLKWPLKNLSPDELATAGFFYRPTASNPDNAVCFLCGKNVDGWEEDDNAVTEHLKLSPECGWAINVYIEQQLGTGNYDIENPLDEKLLDARRMTFGSKWPHESKRGWICKTQKMIESGWYYCPTAESDDYAKCSYCSLGLDGWEPKDNPYDEHRRRSPDCAFFAFTDSLKPKRGRTRKSRTSKASRMSTQSNFTTVSEVTSIGEPEAHETESIILGPAEVERPIKVARGAKKGGKTKKAPAKSEAKAAATKAEDSTLANSFIEPEDDDFEVKVKKRPTKNARNKKRGSDEMNGENDTPAAENDMTEDSEGQPPPAKRRATRARSSVMQATDGPASFLQNGLEVDVSMTDAETMPPPAAPVSKKGVKRGRKKPSSTVRTASGASIASVASLRSAVSSVPDDDEIDAALEAELNRPLTDDEVDVKQLKIQQPKSRRLTRTRPASRNATASTAKVRRATRASTITDSGMNSGDQDISMQDVVGEPTEKASDDPNDDAKNELTAPVSTDKARKDSSKQPSSAATSADYGANASVAALRVQPDLVPPKPKGPRSRQPSRQLPKRNARPEVPPTTEEVAIVDSNVNSIVNIHASVDESGHETDASASSQVPKKRGGKKGFTGTKKKIAGKKAKLVGRHIENIIHLGVEDAMPNQEENGSNDFAMAIAKSPEPDLLQVESTKETLDSKIEEAMEAALKGAQPVLDASPPTSEQREIVDAIGVRSPSQSVSLTENGQGLQDPSKATEFMHESTPSLAETPKKTATQLPSAQTTPRPVLSPQSSDAENQPPSSRPSATRPPLSVKSPLNKHTLQIRSAACTPTALPSKQSNLRLQSAAPWVPADVEKLFLGSPAANEENDPFTVVAVIAQSVNESLTSPEKKLSMEEWIYCKARQAEEKLRSDCERLVGKFEGEGVRALRTLEGISCID